MKAELTLKCVCGFCFVIVWAATCVGILVYSGVALHVSIACLMLSSHLFVCLLSFQGKRLPSYLSADAEEGEVSDDDSADEIEDDFKLKNSNVRADCRHKYHVHTNMHDCFINPLHTDTFTHIVQVVPSRFSIRFRLSRSNIEYKDLKEILLFCATSICLCQGNFLLCGQSRFQTGTLENDRNISLSL